MTHHDPSIRIIAGLDRQTRKTADKVRDAGIRSAAYIRTRNALLAISDDALLCECEGALDAIRDVFTARRDGPWACSLIASRAYQPLIAGPNARARAEQAFAATTLIGDNDD